MSGSIEGRLQEASVFGRASLTLKVDREGSILGEINNCLSNDYGMEIVGIRIPSPSMVCRIADATYRRSAEPIRKPLKTIRSIGGT